MVCGPERVPPFIGHVVEPQRVGRGVPRCGVGGDDRVTLRLGLVRRQLEDPDGRHGLIGDVQDIGHVPACVGHQDRVLCQDRERTLVEPSVRGVRGAPEDAHLVAPGDGEPLPVRGAARDAGALVAVKQERVVPGGACASTHVRARGQIGDDDARAADVDGFGVGEGADVAFRREVRGDVREHGLVLDLSPFDADLSP